MKKAGGPYRIYPAILSQIRNPPVLIRNSTLESFSTSSGISSGRIYLANSGRIYLASSSKFFDRIFVQGNFWISYRENPGYLTLSEGRSSDQQAEGRKSDLRLMFRNRFQSGIPYHDRRISYLGEYCGIATIRSSGLHSFKNKSNLDPDQFFPGFFYSLKNEGPRTLSYLSRNTTTWNKIRRKMKYEAKWNKR